MENQTRRWRYIRFRTVLLLELVTIVLAVLYFSTPASNEQTIVSDMQTLGYRSRASYQNDVSLVNADAHLIFQKWEQSSYLRSDERYAGGQGWLLVMDVSERNGKPFTLDMLEIAYFVQGQDAPLSVYRQSAESVPNLRPVGMQPLDNRTFSLLVDERADMDGIGVALYGHGEDNAPKEFHTYFYVTHEAAKEDSLDIFMFLKYN